jgi:hypothetical protein
MSKRHGAREQKKLAKQKAKKDQRRRQLARLSSPDPTARFAAADRWPIVAAEVSETLWSEGLGYAIIARRTPQHLIAYGVFLLDVYCLGVKDAFWRVDAQDAYDHLRKQIAERGGLKRVSPEYLSKLVHCAADYAQSLGFAPHRDFRHTRLLLAGIDPSQCSEDFRFGKDGKPFYVAGPYDPPHRVREIVARVTAVGGHFLAPVRPEDFDPDDSELGGLREIEMAEEGDDEADDE